MNETYLESQHRFLFLCFFMPHLFVCFLNIYIVDLQCCVSFRYIYSKVIQLHTHTYSFSDSQILFSYMLLQDIKYCPLCYTVGPCWLSVVYIVVYIC